MASILFPHLVEAGGRTYRSLSNLQRLQPPDAGEEPSTSYADKDESLDSNEEQYSVQQRRDEFTIDLRLENAVRLSHTRIGFDKESFSHPTDFQCCLLLAAPCCGR